VDCSGNLTHSNNSDQIRPCPPVGDGKRSGRPAVRLFRLEVPPSGADACSVVRDAELPFVAWPDRAREEQPACLFIGSTRLHDAIAARLIAATAAHLPGVVFELAGPVCGAVGPVPPNVQLHCDVNGDLFRHARLGLSPLVEVPGGEGRAIRFARAGIPVIASPETSRALEPALAACCLVCSPEPERLRDAIVESLEWDWSGPVAEARRIVQARYGGVPARIAA
jgi:hypothetical protein